MSYQKQKQNSGNHVYYFYLNLLKQLNNVYWNNVMKLKMWAAVESSLIAIICNRKETDLQICKH